MVRTPYIEELHALNAEVRAILTTYATDPEEAHASEDVVIERVIRELAHTSLLAQALLPLLDAERDRWYS